MKKLKTISCIFFIFMMSTQLIAADNLSQTESKPTAESVMQFAENMQPADQTILENEINKLSAQEKKKLLAICVQQVKASNEVGEEVPMAVLYILAIILPPLAVGLYTDWDTPTLWNLLFTLIGWLPGVVHAFIVITR